MSQIPEPEMAQFYTLSADYGRLLQLGGRSIRVGTEPGKPIRLTPSQVAQAAGAGVIATPAEVTTVSRPEPADASPKILPAAGDNPRQGKVFDSRGTKPGPFIPPPEPQPAEIDQPAADKE